MRRDFALPDSDEAFLNSYGLNWETVQDGSQWVFLHNFPIPSGFNVRNATAAIRIESGYPLCQLDMVYFNPSLTKADGSTFRCTEVKQPIIGQEFQRWSRHRTAENPWKAGEDDLGSHIMLVEDWLTREVQS